MVTERVKESFSDTVREVIALGAENITVHSLSLKRAAALFREGKEGAAGETERMIDYAHQKLAEHGATLTLDATAQDGSTLGLIAHYPDYENSERKTGGYATLTYVLPVGGIREKLLAALRDGIHTVLIPKDCVKDLKEIPEELLCQMHCIPVETIDDVLNVALLEETDAAN